VFLAVKRSSGFVSPRHGLTRGGSFQILISPPGDQKGFLHLRLREGLEPPSTLAAGLVRAGPALNRVQGEKRLLEAPFLAV